MEGRSITKCFEALNIFIGKWTSICAEVNYPTMQKPVKFNEILEFKHMGQPLLNYTSVTSHPQNKSVMHLEHGFLRVDEDRCTLAFLTGKLYFYTFIKNTLFYDNIRWVFGFFFASAQNFGIATLEEGYVKDNTIALSTACIGIMKFAKQTVLSVHRCYRWLTAFLRFWVNNKIIIILNSSLNEKGELEYTMMLETPQTPLTKHVEVTYKKEITKDKDAKQAECDKKISVN